MEGTARRVWDHGSIITRTRRLILSFWGSAFPHPPHSLSPLSLTDFPSFLVVRFQELDLSAQAFLLDNSGREDEWSKLIESSFKRKNYYRKVASKQLVGMLILVYVRPEVIPSIKTVQTAAAGTGILGMMVWLPWLAGVGDPD